MRSESRTEKSHIGSLGLIDIDIRLEFSHLFQVQVLNEIPPLTHITNYFPSPREHDRDGLLLRITPENEGAWIGLFAADPNGRYKTGVYSCPDPRSICVVSNGKGYVVDVNDPDAWVELPIAPVIEVLQGEDFGLLIAANYTNVLAWGSSGQQWLSERVSFDGISNLRFENGAIQGQAWSPVEGNHQFTLNSASGFLQT